MGDSIVAWKEAALFFGSILALMSLAKFGAGYGCRRKKERIDPVSHSPTHRVESEETVPDYFLTTSNNAHLYHSGQAKLFTPEIQSQTEATGQHIDEIKLHRVPKLTDYLPDLDFYDNEFFRTRTGNVSRKGYSVPVHDDQVILGDLVRTSASHKGTAFVRAGPRAHICFRPSEVIACIVTCGGLCPGLNDVIHEIVQMLFYNYSVEKIYGIRCGYRGFYDPDYLPYMELTPDRVRLIHKTGVSLPVSIIAGVKAVPLAGNCARVFSRRIRSW